jgi:hypothetical protein
LSEPFHRAFKNNQIHSLLKGTAFGSATSGSAQPIDIAVEPQPICDSYSEKWRGIQPFQPQLPIKSADLTPQYWLC